MTTTTLTTTKITAGDVDAAYDEYARVQNLTGTNDPLSEPYYSNTKAAHIRFLRAEAAFLGYDANARIAFFYGKEALIETPPAPATPAPAAPVETPASTPERIRGTVAYWNGQSGSIAYECGFDTQWFTRILGGVTPHRGMQVEFEFAAGIWGHKAIHVMAVGNAKSEAAYQAIITKPVKETPAHTPLPAPRKAGKRKNWQDSAPINFNSFLKSVNEGK